MAEINEYYGAASTATSDYLAHYGIRGMKWGVRRAINSGDSQKLSRQYAKAQKKLAKLEKRAAKTGKYAKRAALMGAGAAAAGAAARLGTNKLAKGAAKVTSGATQLMEKAGLGLIKANPNGALGKAGKAIHKAGVNANLAARINNTKMIAAANKWADSTSISDALRPQMSTAAGKMINAAGTNKGIINSATRKAGASLSKNANKMRGVTNDAIARVGAGLVSAGLAAGAAHNVYKAVTAKGKAEKFRAEMNKAFAGTQYGRKSSGTSKSKKRRR